MPNLPRPAAVWKPQTPDVLYSHIGLELMLFDGMLAGCLNALNPPLLLSKFHGTLSPADGTLDASSPRSTTPFGMRSRSGALNVPDRSRSSPSSLVKCPAGAPEPVNRLEKVTSSRGTM